MITLPSVFINTMQDILRDEYPAFLRSYEEPRKHGLRVNTAKISIEEFERITPFHLEPVPWIEGGYYVSAQDRAARHPYYYAGLYYLQEPTAMTPACVLDIREGDRVLDLCAAPGGKATALGAKLHGTGLLVANDISASRARALLKNLEVFGVPNAFVTNAVPARLAERFPAFFDRVLLDAPCSGEGMFRKDPEAVRAWYPEKPAECARIQKELILLAADMLKPGGRMLYSTCTFSPLENEEIIAHLLRERPQMRVLPILMRPGFSGGLPEIVSEKFPEGEEALKNCVRLWPHRIGGEGHFLALLEKVPSRQGSEDTTAVEGQTAAEDISELEELAATEDFSGRLAHRIGRGENSREDDGEVWREDHREGRRERREERRRERRGENSRKNRGENCRKDRGENRKERPGENRTGRALAAEFLEMVGFPCDQSRLDIRQDQVYLPAVPPEEMKGIPFLRNGLYLGTLKKNRFEPSQSLAMAMDSSSGAHCPCRLSLQPEDERLERYLRGETISVSPEETKSAAGWQLVCVGDYPLGWGKLTGGLLKNHYHAGWRMKY